MKGGRALETTKANLLWLPAPEIITPAGLAAVKPTHANSTPLSRLGCELLPDMTFPDSLWVKVHKGFPTVSTQAHVYLPSLKKFSFLWVGGSRRGEAGVPVGWYGRPKGGRTRKRQEILKIKFPGQCVSTYPSNRSLILSVYHGTGGEATTMNIAGPGSRVTFKKYLRT